MNHIYKTVWNSKLGTWTAAQETAKSHGKSASVDGGVVASCTQVGARFAYTLAASAILMMGAPAMAANGTEYQSGTDNLCYYDTTTQSVICGDATTTVQNPYGSGTPTSPTRTSRSVALGQGAKVGDSFSRENSTDAIMYTDAVAIGTQAAANGFQSTAIGAQSSTARRSTAIGYAADAGGYVTTVAPDGELYGTAIGYQAKAPRSHSVAIGAGATVNAFATTDTARSDAILQSNASNGLIAGTTSATDSAGAVAIGREAKAGGYATIAQGLNANASAAFSTAIGANSIADKMETIAIGSRSEATGHRAIAIGSTFRQAEATVASGDNSIAMGAATNVSGANTTVIGSKNVPVDGKTLDANGGIVTATKGTSITATNSSIIGTSNKIAVSSVTGTSTPTAAALTDVQVQGNSNAVNRGRAYVFGSNNTINTNATNMELESVVAVGYQNTVSGNNSLAVGRLNTVAGGSALAVGSSSKALGTDGIALGNKAYANTGENAVALGGLTHAGQWGTAVGARARAQGDQSIAMGANSAAKNERSFSIGSYSYSGGSGGIAFGYNSLVADGAQSSTAIGAGSVVSGQYSGVWNASLSSGQPQAMLDANRSFVGGNNSYAIGNRNIIGSTSSDSFVLGNNVKLGASVANLTITHPANPSQGAPADNTAMRTNTLTYTNTTPVTGAVALGSDTSVTVDNGVALGKGSVASTAAGQVGADPLSAVTNKTGAAWTSTLGAVSVGDIANNKTRQITSVAAGTQDTDAVNVAQLKAVAAKTPLVVADGTSGVPAGQVVAPAAADAGKLATAGDIANAINNAGFTLKAQGANGSLVNAGEEVDLRSTDSNIVISKVAADNTVNFKLADSVTIGPATGGSPITINGTTGSISGLASNLPATTNGAPGSTPIGNTTSQAAPTTVNTANAATVGDVLNAGWNLQGNGTALDFVKAYDTVNFADGTGTTVTTETDGTKTTIKVNINAQGLAESAQLPVVYTKADGTRVYKRADGNFYDAATGGNVVGAADVVASMQDATGSTTAPTKLTNVAAGVNAADAVNVSQLNAAKTRYYSVNDAGVRDSNYDNDGASGGNSLAAGVGAGATGISSTAIGHKAQATNDAAVALGWNSTASGNHSMALGGSSIDSSGTQRDTTAAGDSSMAIGFGAQTGAGASWSMAIGDLSEVGAGAQRAVALGNLANVTVSDAVALGSGAVADRAALTPSAATSSSASAAANTVYASDAATAADKAAISATVKGALGAVSVGSGTATRQIINVAAGSEDTDAVNVAQLKAVAAKTATTPLVVADGTGNDPVGKVIAPATADAGKLATAGDIANAINKAGFTLTAVAGTGGELGTGSTSNELINAGDTVTVEAGKNIKVTQTNGTINVATKDSVAFTSVTTGGTVMDGSGVTIAAPTSTDPNNTVSLTASGLNNGGKKITNVANGTDPNDAVNFSQLSAVQATANKGWDIGNGTVVVNTVAPGKKVDFVSGNSSNTRVTVGKDAVTGNSIVTVSAAPGAMQYTNTNNAAGNNTPSADQFTPTDQVTLVGAASSTGGVTINNVAPAELSAASKQAVNGSQLYALGDSTATSFGGSSVFDPTTGKVAVGLNVGGTTYNNVQSALNAINTTAGSGWNLQANGGPASNIAPNGTVNVINGNNTTVSLSGNQLQVNVVDNPTFSGPVTANGGLSVANNLTVQPNTTVDMGGNRITNVAPGVNPTDAATVSQLNQASASVNALGNRVNINHDKAMGGVASAMATAGLPQAYLPGKSMIAMGGATYQGRTAVAVGVSTISDNGHWIIKGSLNSNSHGHVGATIGAGYQW